MFSEPVTTDDVKILPLSSNQKRLWIHSQIEGLNPAYNVPFTYRFKGTLNIEVLKRSINALFERHFIMFSHFKQMNGVPYCEIVPEPVEIEFVDFSNELPEKSKEKIYSFAVEDSRKLFNLESGPLYRLSLLKQDDSSFFFHVTIHHLIFDGWSWSVFIRDLMKIYECLLSDREIDLEMVSENYDDYAARLSIPEYKVNEEESIRFWKDYLKDSPPKLNFPYDHLRREIPIRIWVKRKMS